MRFRTHGDYDMLKKAPNGAGYIESGYAGHQINGIKKFDHVRIAETVLGRQLPKDAVVHHANEQRDDNRNDNLVICPDRAYHNLIHARLEAFKATGNPESRRCSFCKQWDLPENVSMAKGIRRAWHTKCRNEYLKLKRREKC